MKTVIITGTSSGLGRSLAECFLKNGFRVMGLSRSKFVDQIHHINYSHHNCDITNLQAIINFSMIIKQPDRKSTRLNSSHVSESRMPSSA